MSIANSTLHFHFPLVVGTDRPLFEDYNTTMETLDEQLYNAVSTLETVPQEISDLQDTVQGIGEQITALETFKTEQEGTNALVNNAILALQAAVAAIPTKFDSAGIADPYDAEHGTYNIGDVVTHNGQRYECVTAVTAAEPFDADKWNAVDVQTKLDSLNTTLSNLDTEITRVWTDVNNTHTIYFRIIDNICLVTFVSADVNVAEADTFQQFINAGLFPNPANEITANAINGIEPTENLLVRVATNGAISVNARSSGTKYIIGSFAYPIANS